MDEALSLLLIGVQRPKCRETIAQDPGTKNQEPNAKSEEENCLWYMMAGRFLTLRVVEKTAARILMRSAWS